MPKERNNLIRDNVFTGLFVALILILLNWFNFHLPMTLAPDLLYAIDVLVMIIVIIVLVKIRKK